MHIFLSSCPSQLSFRILQPLKLLIKKTVRAELVGSHLVSGIFFYTLNCQGQTFARLKDTF